MLIFLLHNVGIFLLLFRTGIIGSILLIIAQLKDEITVFMFHAQHRQCWPADLKCLTAYTIVLPFTNLARLNGIAGILTFTLCIVHVIITFYFGPAIQRFLSVAFPFWIRVKITTMVRYWLATSALLVCVFLIIGKEMVECKAGIKKESDL